MVGRQPHPPKRGEAMPLHVTFKRNEFIFIFRVTKDNRHPAR